ncbi:hypothetical protein HDA36_001089 [Nocardiopsis composta]|uniref:AraC-type transcription regulator ligand-binding domain-containing protein n=1 Tax=Nocardiopsis composta TaxID=157465 RepID=A0A7W8VCI4_9ACTN|nr:hypothetical protein [Nocardiopsis composta]
MRAVACRRVQHEAMDPSADPLKGVRACTAAFCRAVLDPPWAPRIADGAALALSTAVRGRAWVVPDHGGPVVMRTGDAAIVKGPLHRRRRSGHRPGPRRPRRQPPDHRGRRRRHGHPAARAAHRRAHPRRFGDGGRRKPPGGRRRHRAAAERPAEIVPAREAGVQKPVMAFLADESAGTARPSRPSSSGCWTSRSSRRCAPGSPGRRRRPRAGAGRTATGWSALRRGRSTTTRPAPGPSPASRRRPDARGPPSRSGSARWSANPPWPTRPAGGSRSRPTCSAPPTSPSRPSPTGPATPARSP